MKLNKFSPDEIFFNTIKANPKVTFTFVDGETYLNNVSSSNSNVANGMLSAYDLSVDRSGVGRIYQFLNKDSDFAAWKTTTTTTYASALPGTEFKNYLPLTSSVQVEFGTDLTHITSLKNVINYYYSMSPYFDYDTYVDNKEIKLISIPSIFYGSSLEKGATRLDFYHSGSLVATATDKNNNGELIQVSGSTTGGVVGLTLYNEGFIVLFGTASLGASVLDSYTSGYTTGSWIDFADTGIGVLSSAFKLKFSGTTYTPTLTMFAHAGTGKYNFSSNPSFVESGSTPNIISGSMLYAQTPSTIKNITTSSFRNFNAAFKKTTFISKVAIYDEHKKLLGIANLAEPIRKTEDLGYTFKIRLDL